MTTTTPMDGATVRRASRRLRDVCEPIAGSVYFVPEVQERYQALGLDYFTGYFTSRGACMGTVPGEVVASAFGVFNPAVVIPAVATGWSKTDRETILRARQQGTGEALRRLVGEPDTSRIVEILRPVMEAQPNAGRPLFSGLRSLPFPDDPIEALWRVCDYVREHRGDGHVAAWVTAGTDPVEIGLLTECYWGMEAGTYIRTRGWADADIDAGLERLAARGLMRDRALTDDGLRYRRGIEKATDEGERRVVEALGSDAGELTALLEPLKDAVLAGGGYPRDPATFMSRDDDT